MSDIVSIRTAQKQDLDTVTEIEAEAFKSDCRGQDKLDRYISVGGILVAEIDNTTVGYCAITFRNGKAAALLDAVAVVPTAMGKGAGKALLEAAAGKVAHKGYSALRLMVRADNDRAIAIYRKAGYRRPLRRGTFAAYFSDGMTGIRMQKRVVGPLTALGLALARTLRLRG